MDSLTGYVATGLVMLIVGLLLRELEPKVKVVWWSPHQFQFQLPQPPNILLTHAITIQNIGRKKAEGIEIVHTSKPSFFQLQPPLNYVESYTPQGEHIVRVDSLAEGVLHHPIPEHVTCATAPIHTLNGWPCTGHPNSIPTRFSKVVQPVCSFNDVNWLGLYNVLDPPDGCLYSERRRSIIRWVSLRRTKS